MGGAFPLNVGVLELTTPLLVGLVTVIADDVADPEASGVGVRVAESVAVGVGVRVTPGVMVIVGEGVMVGALVSTMVTVVGVVPTKILVASPRPVTWELGEKRTDMGASVLVSARKRTTAAVPA